MYNGVVNRMAGTVARIGRPEGLDNLSCHIGTDMHRYVPGTNSISPSMTPPSFGNDTQL
jgi:hypothetical protein